MNELKRTILFGGVAVGLALLAFISAPRRVTPEAFSDVGEAFFADFDDPNAATTLEVIQFDKETGSSVPFKVTFKDGLWKIPSHHDYPADGKDRLAKTASGVIGVKKDEFRSDNPTDHERLNVIDPLDETSTALEGRGTRITLKGSNEQTLADFILSDEVEGKSKFRFVRIPGQKRVYAARMDLDLSTKFSDWIEADLLKVNKDEIEAISLKDYSINERTGSLTNRDNVDLKKSGSDWNISKLSPDMEVNTTKVNEFLSTLDELSIVGVRTKPEGLSESLRKSTREGMQITREAAFSLQSKGYYFTRDGQLVSNEGEIQAKTKDGLIYTLRFGEVVYGSGLAVTAGTEKDTTGSETGENRYLFITTEFDGSAFVAPQKPTDTSFTGKADSLLTAEDRENQRLQNTYDRWVAKIEAGKKRSNDLNNRFANWYYVISSSSFDKLKLERKDLVKEKKKDS